MQKQEAYRLKEGNRRTKSRQADREKVKKRE